MRTLRRFFVLCMAVLALAAAPAQASYEEGLAFEHYETTVDFRGGNS